MREQPEGTLKVGQVLKDTYRVVEQIGEGGMAAVFRGVQIPLEREVAIKVMLPTLQSTPSMIQRFFKEAKLVCQLSHPNVVQIIDFGNTETELAYMVMELLRGKTLREAVPTGGLGPGQTLSLMRQICSGVGAAHRSGLVHRDLKPDNIFITDSGTAKILDFGIARAAVEGQNETRLTSTGLVMGTPGFLAPEQIGDASEADARSDIYALGAILYFMLTGSRPYDGRTPNSILVQQLQELPRLDLGRLATQPQLAEVVAKAMQREPAGRYQSTDELVAGLESACVACGEEEPTILMGGDVRGRDEITGPTMPLGGEPKLAKKPIPKPPVAALVLVFLLTLAGWWRMTGGSFTGSADKTDAETGTSEETSTVARGVSDDQILVGMSAAFSGAARELGRGMRAGIETCFAEANAAGGVHGRDLTLVALDDGYEPSRTVANMAELLFERQVFAVLGNVGTPTAEVALPLALEQEAPFVGAFSGAGLLRKNPPDRMVFNYRASYAAEAAALVGYFLDVRGLEPSQIVVFAQQDGFGDDGYGGVVAALEDRGYRDEVPRLGYRRNRIDVTPAVDSLLRDHADAKAVILVATYRVAAELIRQVGDRGGEHVFAGLSFIGSRALAEELCELGGSYADGVIVSQVVPHFDSAEPGVERYRRALGAHAPAEQPGFVSLEGYLACRVLVSGLEQVGRQLTVDAFVEAAESMRALDLGTGGAIDLRPEGQRTAHVWGTQLKADATYQMLDLTAP